MLRHGLTRTLVGTGAFMIIGIITMVISLPGRPTLTALALVSGVTVVLGLRRLRCEDVLERRLVWTGFVGRVGSGWLFCCLVSLSAHAAMPAGPAEALTLVAAAMFGCGCWRFVEELSRARVAPVVTPRP